MNDHIVLAPFPRGPLLGAVLLVVLALVAVTVVRLTGIGAAHTTDAAAVLVRDFRFEDRPDGSIGVIDASDGRQVESRDRRQWLPARHAARPGARTQAAGRGCRAAVSA